MLHDGTRGEGVVSPAVSARLVRDTRVRAIFIWGSLRVFLYLGFSLAGALSSGPLIGDRTVLDSGPLLGPVAFVWVSGLAGALLLLDVRVVRETLLFANLGASQMLLFRIALPPVLALEAALQLAFGLLPR